MAVPPRPPPAVMAPRVMPTEFGEKPERWRKEGIQAEMPPREKVTMAMPSEA